MVLSDFILGVVDILSSETTKKDLFAFVLIYSLISGFLFYFFHEIFHNWLIWLAITSIGLLVASIFLFNKGLESFYEGLFLSGNIIKSIGKEKLQSIISEYLRSIPEGKPPSKVFNKFISEVIGKDKVSRIDRTKIAIVGYLGTYLVLYFISFVLFFSVLWTISTNILTSNSFNLFESKNENFSILLSLIFFLILLSFCEIKSEGVNSIFDIPKTGKETNEFVGLISHLFFDSLLWYFTYTPNERKQELREETANKIIENKIFRKLFKMLFAVNLPELISGIKVISRSFIIPLLGKDNEKKNPQNEYKDIENKIKEKFSLIEIIGGTLQRDISKLKWKDLVDKIGKENEKGEIPLLFYFLVSKKEHNESNEKECVDSNGFLLSFVSNPYFYRMFQKRPYIITQMIEEKNLYVYILLIVREEKYKEYERFLATVT
jgi:hypothetical protein